MKAANFGSMGPSWPGCFPAESICFGLETWHLNPGRNVVGFLVAVPCKSADIVSSDQDNMNSRVGDARVGGRILSSTRGKASYVCRLAAGEAEIKAAQRLRFEVFNLELEEGLPESYRTGLDADQFDEVCDHLLVLEESSGEVVMTYRLQSGLRARECLGYYSAQEFDFSPLEPFRSEIIELGRACIHQDHRNLRALGCLWRAIDVYAKNCGGRYLIGCSSLTSQDESVGAGAYEVLRKHLAPEEFRVMPLDFCACSMEKLPEKPVRVPKLLGAYLSVGAKICGPPAIDRTFKTIDYLTILDITQLPSWVLESL